MLLSVNKVPKKLGTDTLNKVLDFAEKYLKLNPKLEIHIDFIRTKKFLGQYEGIDEHGETHYIDISEGESQEDIIRSIFHELVHVRQTDDGDLSLDGNSWKGFLYRTKEMEVEYDHLPWEKEAAELEEKMWRIYNATYHKKC
tara:strand:- start:73 stop:498 length:426 start_codon:yes stop_codon:yes gene_type:complete